LAGTLKEELEKRMLSILLVGKESASLAGLAEELTTNDKINVSQVASGREVMEVIENSKVDVVVTAEDLADGPALSFVQELIKKQPLINCAMVSALASENFHEATEGLGVFMQLPVHPAAEEAVKMVKLLESINSLMAA
jgi:DNA-binding NtrC family response regulator